MPSKNPAQRLRDIVHNIDAIAAFTADRKTAYAVIRALEIVSEPSRRLPDGLKGVHPEIDWIAVAAAGNIYRHEYDVVDEKTDLAYRAPRHG